MKMFIKRFWGFDPIYWPVVTFGLRGSLDTLLADSSPGDLMAFVGTQGEETEEHERGRLLGFVEFGRNPVHSREALPPQNLCRGGKGTKRRHQVAACHPHHASLEICECPASGDD